MSSECASLEAEGESGRSASAGSSVLLSGVRSFSSFSSPPPSPMRSSRTHCVVCRESKRRVRSVADVLFAADISLPPSELHFNAKDVENAERAASERSSFASGGGDGEEEAKYLRAKVGLLAGEYSKISAQVGEMISERFLPQAKIAAAVSAFADKLHDIDELARREDHALKAAVKERNRLKRELDIERQIAADERARKESEPEQRSNLAEERQKHRKISALLEELRNKRCREVYELFPVVPGFESGGVVGTVGDFRVSVSDSVVANLLQETCSGYALLARMLATIASYLGIPLRHPTNISAQVAVVVDTDGNSYPLTPSSSDFFHAIRLLSENVCELCILQGVPRKLVDNDPRSVLQNVWQLFHCPSLGRDIHRCLSDAERRIGSSRRTSSAASDVDAFARSDLAATLRMVESMNEIEMPDDCEGWNVMNKPRPPRPSQRDDIEHWERSHTEQEQAAGIATQAPRLSLSEEVLALLKLK